jgi:hypothetical protein
MKREWLLTIAIGVTGLVLSEAAYIWGIVPRLPTVTAVPVGWWLLQMAPSLAAVLVVGARRRSWADVVAHGTLLGALNFAWDVALALRHAPGTHKSLLWDAPLPYWTIGPLASIGLAVAGVALVFGARRLWLSVPVNAIMSRRD